MEIAGEAAEVEALSETDPVAEAGAVPVALDDADSVRVGPTPVPAPDDTLTAVRTMLPLAVSAAFATTEQVNVMLPDEVSGADAFATEPIVTDPLMAATIVDAKPDRAMAPDAPPAPTPVEVEPSVIEPLDVSTAAPEATAEIVIAPQWEALLSAPCCSELPSR